MSHWTLQQKMILFLLLPVAALLTAMGWFRFTYARDNMLKDWREAAILRLQRAAHQVDMRLGEPRLWMRIFGDTGEDPQAEAVRKWIVEELNRLPGVERASVAQFDRVEPPRPESRGGMTGMHGPGIAFDHPRVGRVTPPHFDARAGHETVSLVSDLMNATDQKVGELVVDVRFDHLMENVMSYAWRQNETASLLDDGGKPLACEAAGDKNIPCLDEAEIKVVLDAMKEKTSGTIVGHPAPDGKVIGFYRLKEAPWTLVVVAQDRQILTPINRFRDVSLMTGFLFTVVILLLIRTAVGGTMASIQEVSKAAQRVAEGDYGVHLAGGSDAEIVRLIDSFNAMVVQLEERMRLKEALDLAMGVQQNLLPAKPPDAADLDIAGTCVYCDETGGDYYDFLEFPELGEGKIGLAVGDVAGHGISAALLMTTARAMIRMRISQPGALASAMNDVNRLLCYDTERSGDFMTLFLGLLDTARCELRWVRAGHAPALLYDWQNDAFQELMGEGFALGFDSSCDLKEYRYDEWSSSKLLFIGTDGIWETENPDGELFGIDRLRTILRENWRFPSRQIVEAVLGALKDFRQWKAQEDDVTMVIVKSR